jgi:ferredoxin
MQEDEKDFLETMAAEPDERLACQCKVSGDIVVEVSE